MPNPSSLSRKTRIRNVITPIAIRYRPKNANAKKPDQTNQAQRNVLRQSKLANLVVKLSRDHSSQKRVPSKTIAVSVLIHNPTKYLTNKKTQRGTGKPSRNTWVLCRYSSAISALATTKANKGNKRSRNQVRL